MVILTHWGIPKSYDPQRSTRLLVPVIEKHLGQPVEFINQFAGFTEAKAQIETSDKQVFLLENTRFDPREQAQDSQTRLSLAKEYATLGTVFVNEAATISKSQEATNYELKQLLPNCLGLNYEREMEPATGFSLSTISIKQIYNSTVLLRADLDLPSLNSDYPIVAIIPTIRQLVANHNKVVILTHWGIPKSYDPQWSTRLLVPVIEKHLGQPVEFINQFAGFTEAKAQIETSDKQVFLLENTRFDPRERSIYNRARLALAKEYATLGTVFVDESFAISHDLEVIEATNINLQRLLPNFLGLNYQQEIRHLNKIGLNKIKACPKHPYALVIGGNKLKTKLSLIRNFLDKIDYILLAGTLSFTFIQAKTELIQTNQLVADQPLPNLQDSLGEPSLLNQVKAILVEHASKLILPVDLVYFRDGQKLLAYDIGPKTVSLFQTYLSQCQIIVWNGPLGVYEQPPFDQGTKAIAKFLAELTQTTKPYIVIAGKETSGAIPKEYLSQFTWVSTGGESTLRYLEPLVLRSTLNQQRKF